MSLFITGTDTGVGKTHTVVLLLRLLRASGIRCAGMKPICCGDRHDAELILAAGEEGLTIDQINPIWLKTPVAPLPAALVEGVEIDLELLLSAFATLQSRVDVVLVEGVGGWMVPIKEDYFVSDLAAAMNLPVLVVAQNRLGCLNHTVLTVQSVIHRGLLCAGVALNDVPAPESPATITNGDILRKILATPVLCSLTEKTTSLPPEWQRVLGHPGAPEMFVGHTQV